MRSPRSSSRGNARRGPRARRPAGKKQMSVKPGTFYGIGVGPGEPGLMPVIAWQALQTCHVIYAPRAQSAPVSAVRRCLEGLDVPDNRIREIEFETNPDRKALRSHYAELARMIAGELCAAKNVAYITIGDPFTYSTYGDVLAALKDLLPGLTHRTFPGVTSYAAASAALDWPLGAGKERVLIAPCPAEMSKLREDIESHDIVVLMKIGEDLADVLELVREMGIEETCALAAHVGMREEKLFGNLAEVKASSSLGALSTMLIRKAPRGKRF